MKGLIPAELEPALRPAPNGGQVCIMYILLKIILIILLSRGKWYLDLIGVRARVSFISDMRLCVD